MDIAGVQAALEAVGAREAQVAPLADCIRATWRTGSVEHKVLCAEVAGALVLFAPICRQSEMTAEEAVALNGMLAAGAVVPRRGWYLLRCAVALAGDDALRARAMLLVADQAARLRANVVAGPRVPIFETYSD